jgi:MoaA/NifB/PqqE/SkfB family radical SAM enzyme
MLRVAIALWGEPLLHTSFWEMVRKVKRTGTKVGFTTNGTPLNPKNLDRLLETDVDIMAVSLAGTSPDSNERFRQGCDLDRIDAALVALRQKKREHCTETPNVHIAFMLLRSNWRELDQLPDLAAEWGASQVIVFTRSCGPRSRCRWKGRKRTP